MPRVPRKDSYSGYHHVTMRGITKKDLFHEPRDFDYFMKLLYEYKRKFLIQIFHYCLMTNHLHLVIQADSVRSLSKFAQFVQRCYAYHYRRNYKWDGQVFERHFKSIPIESDAYLVECGRYVERNPVNAGVVRSAADYPYSSYHYYAFGQEDAILSESPCYEAFGKHSGERNMIYRNYVSVPRDYELPEYVLQNLRKIRLGKVSSFLENNVPIYSD